MKPKAGDTVDRLLSYRDRPIEKIGQSVCPSCGGTSSSARINETRVCERCLFGVALEIPDLNPSCESEERPSLPATAHILGSYRLAEEIGRGGMGVIYRAVHRETNEVVALKTILPEHARCSETLERFRREAMVAQSLAHTYSMPIYEVGCSAQGTPFFSMKLAVGGSLYNLGAKYRGRWRQIAELMIKISMAVHHAHERGILHRDLKPGNILFTEDHEPLVTDFGLAKQLTCSDDLTQSSTVLGTPNYVSPEQAAGKTRDLTAGVDIYSLGAILFDLLTGRPPFLGDNPLDVLRQVASQSPDRPRRLVPSVPKALEAICLRCVERRPRDRYSSARDLANDLNRWLQGRSIVRPPVYIRLWRLFGRHLQPAAWCCLILGLATSLGLALMLHRGPGRDSVGIPTIAVAIDDLDQNFSLNLAARRINAELKRAITETRVLQSYDREGNKSRSSTGIFDPLAYGRACSAQDILAGCVRRSGEQIRLVTRLMRCDTGEVLWRHVDSLPSNSFVSALPPVATRIVSDLQASWDPNVHSFVGVSHNSPLPEAQVFYTRATELVARKNRPDLEAAILSFRRAANLDPHFGRAHSMLAFALWAQADMYGELNKIPLAISAAKEALTVDPDSSQAHRVLAGCDFKAARYDEALEEYRVALELDPQSPGCCQSLGICLREMGHPHQAIFWLTRAVQLDVAHGIFGATLGESLALCGYDQQAEAALNHAIDLDGDRPDFQIALSALRTWKKEFGEARRLCSQMCRRFPDVRFGLSLAAWIELCDQKNSDAERDFEILKAGNSYQQDWEFYGAINPTSALAYLAKQNGATERTRLLAADAFTSDRELLVRYPRNSRILHDLAATYAITGETEQSLHFLQEAISAGWAEQRSTWIDPRFASIASLPRFKEILAGTLPDIP